MTYKLPYEFSREPEPGEPAVLNLPCELGIQMGEIMATLAEPCLAEFRAEHPTAAPPCAECAFIRGTMPNGSLETQGDTMKCLVEGGVFYCHKFSGDAPKRMCAGFAAMSTTLPAATKAREILRAANKMAEANNPRARRNKRNKRRK